MNSKRFRGFSYCLRCITFSKGCLSGVSFFTPLCLVLVMAYGVINIVAKMLEHENVEIKGK